MRIILKIIGSLRPIDSNCKGVDMEVKNKRDVPKIRFNIYRKSGRRRNLKILLNYLKGYK